MRNMRIAICAALVLSGCGISQEQDISQISSDSGCEIIYSTLRVCYNEGDVFMTEHGCESIAVTIDEIYADAFGPSHDDTAKDLCHSICLNGINKLGLPDISSVCK